MSLKAMWEICTFSGMRNVAGFVKLLFGQFQDTLFYFDDHTESKCIALTIDDGLCYPTQKEHSKVEDVRKLLEKHKAHATFFLIGNRIRGCEDEAKKLIADGHEFGCHGEDDRDYIRDSLEDFQNMLDRCVAGLKVYQPQIRWFRAPKGLFTPTMHTAISKRRWCHVLMDCYCDDWGVDDPEWIADIILRQVRSGSIINLHMPSQEHFSHIYRALELVLQGLDDKGLRCQTLTELSAHAKAVAGPSIQGQNRHVTWAAWTIALPMQCISSLLCIACSCICAVLALIISVVLGPVAFVTAYCLWGSGVVFASWFVLTLSKILSFLPLLLLHVLWMITVFVINSSFRLFGFGLETLQVNNFVEVGVPPFCLFNQNSILEPPATGGTLDSRLPGSDTELGIDYGSCGRQE
eukprot:TRINITY_DN42354_c0_g1_i1.p1 TRINITY_DN42354_c0_g1~~TRINITY_DN42354_c0_g1_i1.p1  ORF type:complete len:407 (+),score=48.92 TRINITY_DN42354_c0_g1_i1:259-1479(+)